MILEIERLLSAEACATLCEELGKAGFVDGAATAGWSARLVKRNQQAPAGLATDACREAILSALTANSVFQTAALPKRIIGPTFSRYRPGDAYGIHVDDTIIDGSRTDLSFTLFLSSPYDYNGGELVISGPGGEDAVKGNAGSLVLYTSGTLHEVRPVTRGERLAAVGWVRSLVRDPAQRELLFDLERARRSLFERHGKSAEFDLISRCSANLLRMWAED
ncbi:MAG: Fe2+-dependent dioxygenase [Proteobacteria bacterium]|nr:Fe2+-dependent dioxygenase [Pseudomonadota bacterium]